MHVDQGIWLFLMHVAGCVLASLASWRLMPSHYRSMRRGVVAYHFLLAFFLPVFGVILVLALALVARSTAGRCSPHHFQVVRLPVFTAATREPTLNYGIGSIRSRLTNSRLSQDVRLKALLTVQAMPGNLSTRLLREVLSDPADDLRLTAYGMLDKGEKLLNQAIQENLKLLDAATDVNRRAQVEKQLAMNYWELVYQGFAQGELRSFSLGAAWRHARAAAQRLGDDADLWVLIGRIAMERRDIEAAAEAFDMAQRQSVRGGRVRTYMAELAFLKRDFATVRKLIGDVARQECGLSTAPLRAFWQAEEKA